MTNPLRVAVIGLGRRWRKRYRPALLALHDRYRVTTLYDQVQQQTGWLTCGACGNTGGGGALATYQMTRGITTPSLSGSSAQFSIGGNYPYADAYWYYRHTARDTQINSLRYEFDMYVPAGSENSPQAIEFECQQNSNGYTYNYAWQADYASKTWRVFNYTTKHWEPTNVGFQAFAPDTWHHIIAMYHASGTQVVHDSITVDGVTHSVNITHDALFTGSGLELTNAFQVDLDGNSSPYHVYVDNMTVSLKD